VVALCSIAETKVKADAQLQTFSYPAISKLFPSLNTSVAISHSQTLPFKYVINREKTLNFFPPSGTQRPNPSILGTDEVHTNFASQKHSGLMYRFTAEGC